MPLMAEENPEGKRKFIVEKQVLSVEERIKSDKQIENSIRT
jgi:hypothetical protein